jgi:hypothetical protein
MLCNIGEKAGVHEARGQHPRFIAREHVVITVWLRSLGGLDHIPSVHQNRNNSQQPSGEIFFHKSALCTNSLFQYYVLMDIYEFSLFIPAHDLKLH